MNSRAALPLLALALTSCASKPRPPQPIAAVAEQRQCPAFPLPPSELLKPPVKINFLSPTPSSPQSRPSSSMN
jgi:hypothetical protein